MAKIDLGKIAITPEGEWSATRYYEKLSLVVRNGQSYLSLRNTTGDEPEASRDDWMLLTSRGESLYQMMVREGKFVGTEEEFLQQYLDSLKACSDASEEVRASLATIIAEMETIRADVEEMRVEENIRIKNEAKREDAEIKRKNADTTRDVNERRRDEAEQRREQSMTQIQTDARIALEMASQAQQKAEEAVLNEEERVEAEKQRKIDEATRIQAENQRVNDEAMRRSREGDRQDAENTRQKNEGDRILAEREREATMNDLVAELKALAGNKFKIVDALPAEGEFAVIYLVPSPTPSGDDIYNEWAYINKKWERIGSASFNLENYYTKEEVDERAANAPIVLTYDDKNRPSERKAFVDKVVEYLNSEDPRYRQRRLMPILILGDGVLYVNATVVYTSNYGFPNARLCFSGVGVSDGGELVGVDCALTMDGDVDWEGTRTRNYISTESLAADEDIDEMFPVTTDFSADFSDDFGSEE